MNKSYIFVLAGLIVLGGLVYFMLQDGAEQPPVTNNDQQHANNPTPAEPPPPAFMEINVDYKNGQPFESKSTRVEEGQKVVLRVSSDVADEVHLHGYDISVEIKPGTPATLEFDATQTGRFNAELEHLQKDISIIEVYPK